MSTIQVIAVLVAATFVVLVLLSRRSGPRITTIETRREEEKDDQ